MITSLRHENLKSLAHGIGNENLSQMENWNLSEKENGTSVRNGKLKSIRKGKLNSKMENRNLPEM